MKASRSLVSRIQQVNLVIGLGIVILSILSISLYSYRQSRTDRDAGVQALGEALAKLVARPITLGDFPTAEATLRAVTLPNYICRLEIHSASRETIAAATSTTLTQNVRNCRGPQRTMTFPVRSPTIETLAGTPASPEASLEMQINDAELTQAAIRLALLAAGLGILLLSLLWIVSRLAVRRSLAPLFRAIDEASVQNSPDHGVIQAAPSEIQPLFTRLATLYKSVAQAEGDARVGKIAAQVAHDIRSPLASLIATVHNAPGLDEKSLSDVRIAVNRIRDIANNLLAQHRQKTSHSSAESFKILTPSTVLSSEPRSIEMVSALVESAVSQNRLQYKEKIDLEIKTTVDTDVICFFSEVQPTEFHRIVSNLINNSVDAMDEQGTIEIKLCKSGRNVCLSFKDYGKGIPVELLPKVVERGGTFGKRDGNGYGLSHAKATVEAWGGTFRIESQLGKGTVVSVELLPVDPPGWFADKIQVSPGMTVVTVDDERCIHEKWANRLADSNVRLTHLDSAMDFLAWYRMHPALEHAIYFCDYEFVGQNQTGIDLISMTGISAQAILLTNRWDDEVVREKCQKLGIKLLPKMLLEKNLIHLSE
jgi:signal transduction histidine kinase